MKFFNSTKSNMDFEEVVNKIKEFIMSNPDCKFRLAVGTDSQVKGRRTCFAIGIHIHRIGQGAWCCVSKNIEKRKYTNLREKISKETSITYDVLYMLNQRLTDLLCELIMNHKNFDCKLEAHIDVGKNGETRKLIREMIGYFEGVGIDAKIKPDSFVASSYANKFSKNIKVNKLRKNIKAS